MLEEGFVVLFKGMENQIVRKVVYIVGELITQAIASVPTAFQIDKLTYGIFQLILAHSNVNLTTVR